MEVVVVDMARITAMEAWRENTALVTSVNVKQACLIILVRYRDVNCRIKVLEFSEVEAEDMEAAMLGD